MEGSKIINRTYFSPGTHTALFELNWAEAVKTLNNNPLK